MRIKKDFRFFPGHTKKKFTVIKNFLFCHILNQGALIECKPPPGDVLKLQIYWCQEHDIAVSEKISSLALARALTT